MKTCWRCQAQTDHLHQYVSASQQAQHWTCQSCAETTAQSHHPCWRCLTPTDVIHRHHLSLRDYGVDRWTCRSCVVHAEGVLQRAIAEQKSQADQRARNLDQFRSKFLKQSTQVT